MLERPYRLMGRLVRMMALAILLICARVRRCVNTIMKRTTYDMNVKVPCSLT